MSGYEEHLYIKMHPRSSPKELSRVEGFRLIKNQLVPETVKTSVFRINFNIYVYIRKRKHPVQTFQRIICGYGWRSQGIE